MSYQGLVFAITVGVAIGVAIYGYFAAPQPIHHEYRNSNTSDYNHTLEPRSVHAPNRPRNRRRNKEEICSICLTNCNMSPNNRTFKTFLCGHTFHIHCISGWRRTGNSTCPNCRETLQ